MFYSRSQVAKLFTSDSKNPLSVSNVTVLEKLRVIPPAEKNKVDQRRVQGWNSQDLPLIGPQLGYLTKPNGPLVYSFFVTKGGVLKTALALNLARMAALHGIRTCVIGLDMQCDLSTALGHMDEFEVDDLDSALRWIEETRGLYDLFSGRSELRDIILPTDLPTLFYIPETPELVALEQNLLLRPRREQWLQEVVLTPLKKQFDLIVLDCSPNWNQLITNALIGSDVLVSPLECKINNFRNLKMFRTFIHQVKKDLNLHFRHFYIPTRLNLSRTLSRDIFGWYNEEIPECLKMAIRDCAQGEEATALHLSLPEYHPGSTAALEIASFLRSIWVPNLEKDKKSQRRPESSSQTGFDSRSLDTPV